MTLIYTVNNFELLYTFYFSIFITKISYILFFMEGWLY